jgi:RimJ/RimL family protein N-acetyltransferase
MHEVPVLAGSRVVLRPLRPEDKTARLALGRDPEFVRLNGGDPSALRAFTAEDADRWLAAFPESLRWAVELDGRLIGEVRLDAVDREAGVARFAIGIFRGDEWGKGYGTEATRLVLRHAFESLGLRRVELRVLASNERAIRSYEKCGFVRGGYERQQVLIAGEWHRDLRMAITDEIYRLASPRWTAEA